MKLKPLQDVHGFSVFKKIDYCHNEHRYRIILAYSKKAYRKHNEIVFDLW